MKVIRKIVNWITTHRLVSASLFVAILALAIFIGIEVVHSEGIVSDPLVKGTIIQSVYGIGTVTATKSYQIKPGVTSTIDALFIEEGEIVKKGTALMRADGINYKAPFNGTVTSLPNKVGENVFADIPMLILVDLSDRYVVVSLEQQGALRILPGQQATLSFDTMRSSNFNGTVKSIYSNGNNFLARIDIPNFPPRILPGMTADVAITISTHPDILLLPIAALEDGQFVWVKHFFSKKVPIKTGIVDKAFAEVLSGDLQAGDRVLIRKQAGP